jgi:hypothetical protein
MTTHHHAIKATLGLMLAVGAIAPATASARFDQNPVFVPRPASQPTAVQPAVQVVRVSAGGGFNWGDAGIGAAGGLGLSILGVAGSLGVTRRRDRRTTRSAAAIS